MGNRPMSEDFVNSGWKEKKLWTPDQEEDHRRGASQKLKVSSGTRGIAGTLEAGEPRGGKGAAETRAAAPVKRAEASHAGDGGSHTAHEAPREVPIAMPAKPAKVAKPPRSPKGPLEVLDPESSSSDESEPDNTPPEFAVLDMHVPRTAMVINVTHVLKRLSGCCSLNQLSKALPKFKENTGVTLEQFLRANPDSFKLEGRIVFLVDREGTKWKPPPEDPRDDWYGKGRSKGKGEGKGDGRVEGKGKGEGKGEGKGSGKKGGKGAYQGKQQQQQHYDEGHYRQEQPRSVGGGDRVGGGKSRGGQQHRGDDAWWDTGWSTAEWSGGRGDGWTSGGWHSHSW